MNDLFNKDPLATYNTECQSSFFEFAKAHNIKSETDVEAYLITQQVYTAGFMNGAKLILDNIVARMKAAEKAKAEAKQ